MRIQKFIVTLFGPLLISGAMGVLSQAHAAGYCSGGTSTEGISVGDVTFNNVGATNCYGVVGGNITGGGKYAGAPVLNAMDWGNGWSYLDSSGASVTTFMGLAFTVDSTSGASGTWTLTGVDTNSTALHFPATLDLVVGLKAGNEYALWGFDNVVVDGSDSGTFNIAFTNNGGNHPALSHMIIFGREASGGSIAAAIPEADNYAMMLAGLSLVGLMVRRRSQRPK